MGHPDYCGGTEFSNRSQRGHFPNYLRPAYESDFDDFDL